MTITTAYTKNLTVPRLFQVEVISVWVSILGPKFPWLEGLLALSVIDARGEAVFSE